MVLFHALLYKEKIMVEYKKFKTRETYKGLNMIGETVEIPRGTDVECRRGHIYYDGAPVCYYTSQIARDYFVWNDNDDFNARAVLLNTILFNNDMKVWTEEVDVLSQTGEVVDKVFTIKQGKFTPKEAEMIKLMFPKMVENDSNLRFSQYFFTGSSIKELSDLAIAITNYKEEIFNI